MKIKYLLSIGIKRLTAAMLLIFSTYHSNAQAPVVQTFSFTGGQQTFTVPSCVASITIDARGAQGAQSNDRAPTNSVGGLGGRAIGVLSVVAGQVLYINVGGVGNINGSGGFNGGGAGGASTAGASCLGGPAGGGGGASDVRLGGTAISNRVIVAGGGGGSGRDYCNGTCQPCGCGGTGGSGGGTNGVVGVAAGNCGFGYPGLNTNGGGGGGAAAGGAGGIGDNSGPNGIAGTLALGGAGAAGSLDVAGGGGGGGYYGGGGGGSASSGSGVGGGGGGGGSSYITGLTAASSSASFQTGNGLVILSYGFNGSLAQVSTLPSNTICVGTTATVTASNLVSYTWSPGGSNVVSFTTAPTSNTNYTVLGTNNIGCNSQAVVNIVVVPAAPVLTVVNTASATGGICPNSTVALTASGAASYSWTNGVINGAVFGPVNSATYVVAGQNACGSASVATSVSVHPLPNVTAVASQPSICNNVPVSISGIGNAVTYSVVNSGVPYASNFFPQATAVYTLVGTSAQSCTNSAVTGVTVVTVPVNPPVASPPLICIGSTATLSSSGATTYSWISSTGIQTTNLITVSPNANTTYTLTKSNANCVNTQTIQLFVNQLPTVFAIASPTLICASRPATLQAGGAQTYTWTTAGPPAFTVTGSSPVVSPSVTTLYTVAASDGTCANTTTVLLTTNPNPTLNISPSSTNICRGDAVSLTVSGAIGYSWTAGVVNSNSTNVTITETPTASVNYQVTGINNFNCTTNGQQVVVVRTTPTLQIGTTKPLVCIGGASGLTVTSQGGVCTYTWDANAAGVTSSVAVVNPLTSTIYSVVGTAANQCTATGNYPVSVFIPSFAVNSPTSSCLGGTITLMASGANSYTWNGNQPFSQISVSPSTATFYLVSATSTSNQVNCISSNTVFVTIYSNPTITAVPNRTQICRGEFTDIVGGGAVTYTLNTGLSGSVIPVNPNSNTIYTLTGTDQNGCTNTKTVQVRTSTCFGIDELNKLAGTGLSIFPNPNTGNFTLKAMSDLHLYLISELGQVLRIIDLTEGNAHQVQVSDLATGIYFISGKKGELLIREKIVVQK
jgi:hypothetical protein